MLVFIILAEFLALGKEFNTDSDPTVYISPNGKATFYISSNPTTGYSWTMIPTNSVYIQVSDLKGSYVKSDTHAMGAGGKQFFEIMCTTECHDGLVEEVTLIYSRPWEKEAVQFKTVKIVVTSDPTLIN